MQTHSCALKQVLPKMRDPNVSGLLSPDTPRSLMSQYLCILKHPDNSPLMDKQCLLCLVSSRSTHLTQTLNTVISALAPEQGAASDLIPEPCAFSPPCSLLRVDSHPISQVSSWQLTSPPWKRLVLNISVLVTEQGHGPWVSWTDSEQALRLNYCQDFPRDTELCGVGSRGCFGFVSGCTAGAHSWALPTLPRLDHGT